MVAILGYLSCVVLVSLITCIPMYKIINFKFFNIVSGFFYSTMSDTTLSISEVMKDSLQLEMNDLSLTKHLTDKLISNMN